MSQRIGAVFSRVFSIVSPQATETQKVGGGGEKSSAQPQNVNKDRTDLYSCFFNVSRVP